MVGEEKWRNQSMWFASTRTGEWGVSKSLAERRGGDKQQDRINTPSVSLTMGKVRVMFMR